MQKASAAPLPLPTNTSSNEPRSGNLAGKNDSHESWKLLMGLDPHTGCSLAQIAGSSLQERQSLMLCMYLPQRALVSSKHGKFLVTTGGGGATSLFREELYV